MMNHPSDLTNDALLAEVKRLAASERTTTAALVAHLAELEARQLHVAAGFRSLFLYCHKVLGLPEDATCNRTTAVRMVRAFPPVLGKLEDGRLNLSTLRMLAPYLTAANHAQLLEDAFHKSKRDVDELIARRFPRTVTTSIRKLPARRPSAPGADGAGSGAAEAAPAEPVGAPAPVTPVFAAPRPRAAQPAVKPMSEDIVLIKLAAHRPMVERLRRAQDLLRHALPSGDIVEVFDRGLIALIRDLEKAKFGATDHPRAARAQRPRSRKAAAEVRRDVADRDERQCTFVAADGRRCDSRAFLEFHHRRPYAAGGGEDVENMALLCRAHNQYEADVYFGPIRQAMSERDSIRPGAD